jgi:outer membrane lipoprotein-sorting protein
MISGTDRPARFGLARSVALGLVRLKADLRRARRGLAVAGIALALALAGPARAAHAWGLEQLMIELGRVQHAKARFVERKYLEVLTKPLELAGTLEYSAPDRLERRTLSPKPESFVVDGDRLTLEDARGRRRSFALQDNPVLWAFVESIRSTLKGDLAALERFYAVSLHGGREDWQLVLEPKERRMSAIVSSIRIGGRDGKIGSIEIRETRGDRSEMTIVEEGR